MSRLYSALDNDDDDGDDIKPHVKITFEYCYDGTEPAVIDIRRDALCPWCMQGTTTPRVKKEGRSCSRLRTSCVRGLTRRPPTDYFRPSWLLRHLQGSHARFKTTVTSVTPFLHPRYKRDPN